MMTYKKAVVLILIFTMIALPVSGAIANNEIVAHFSKEGNQVKCIDYNWITIKNESAFYNSLPVKVTGEQSNGIMFYQDINAVNRFPSSFNGTSLKDIYQNAYKDSIQISISPPKNILQNMSYIKINELSLSLGYVSPTSSSNSGFSFGSYTLQYERIIYFTKDVMLLLQSKLYVQIHAFSSNSYQIDEYGNYKVMVLYFDSNGLVNQILLGLHDISDSYYAQKPMPNSFHASISLKDLYIKEKEKNDTLTINFNAKLITFMTISGFPNSSPTYSNKTTIIKTLVFNKGELNDMNFRTLKIADIFRSDAQFKEGIESNSVVKNIALDYTTANKQEVNQEESNQPITMPKTIGFILAGLIIVVSGISIIILRKKMKVFENKE